MTQIAAMERNLNINRAETSLVGKFVCVYPGATEFSIVRSL